MIGEMWAPQMKPDNGHRVAVVGGGPAGLTCAYYLVIDGYRPTIFEASPRLGGMLRYGIPEYRLPRDVLDKEIDWITGLGVEIRLNQRLGKDFAIDDLFGQGFESVFVGLGAQSGKAMRVENEDVGGVLSGVEFLRQVEMKTNPDIGGRVVVVGGGNTALDAARSSVRLGAEEVVLLYRRTRKEMPANDMEIDAAEEEGVRMEFLAAPIRVNSNDGRMVSLECIRMELGEPDDSGRRRPVSINGSQYTLEADWVISAIGQEPDLGGIGDDKDIKATRWHTIEAAKKTFATDREGVFAGGDVVTGPADAIDAIAAGRMAALAIDTFIRTGQSIPPADSFESKRDSFHTMTADDLPEIGISARHDMPELPAVGRAKTFDEVETGYTDADAREESLRCAECGCDVALSCTLRHYCTEYGVNQQRFGGSYSRFKVDTRHPFIKIDSNKCIRCGRCVSTCSEILNVSALGFVNRGFKTIVKPALEKALHETNCVSCGNCIDVCPTGALNEKMPFRRSGPWKMESVFNICNYCSVGCNITLNVKSTDLFFVTGAPPDLAPNNGELCVRGRFGYQQYLDGSRLTEPMVRRGDKLVKASWDEAFEAIKQGFDGFLENNKRDQMMFSASPKHTNEELYLAGRLARASVGTNNLASFHRLENNADYHALDDMLGHTVSTVTEEDVKQADLYLFLGGNPTSDNPVLGWLMKRNMVQGTQAIVINSAEIDLVRYSSVWADARRGTSTVLLNGLMALLIREGKIDKQFLADNTVNFPQMEAELTKYDMEETVSISGVSEEKIRRMANLISAPDKKIVAIYNHDSRVDRSTSDLKALATLMLLLGRIGGGSGMALTTSQCNHSGAQLAGFDNQLLPGGQLIGNVASLKACGAVWQTDLPALIDHSGFNLKRKIRQGYIRGAVILGENPAVNPDYNQFIDGLDFLVVADMFRTDTVKMADVFLPLSAYLENEGHFTNWSGRIQATAPIGEPMTGMSNADLLARLSSCFGVPLSYNSLADITSELQYLIDHTEGIPGGENLFATADGLAHFVPYATEVSTTSAKASPVLEIDSRMHSRLKLIQT
ncbi:MAG: molybdopterin-dependent oxidoreductase [Candidatus Zixiibacteriota bacterium]